MAIGTSVCMTSASHATGMFCLSSRIDTSGSWSVADAWRRLKNLHWSSSHKWSVPYYGNLQATCQSSVWMVFTTWGLTLSSWKINPDLWICRNSSVCWATISFKCPCNVRLFWVITKYVHIATSCQLCLFHSISYLLALQHRQ